MIRYVDDPFLPQVLWVWCDAIDIYSEEASHYLQRELKRVVLSQILGSHVSRWALVGHHIQRGWIVQKIKGQFWSNFRSF